MIPGIIYRYSMSRRYACGEIFDIREQASALVAHSGGQNSVTAKGHTHIIHPDTENSASLALSLSREHDGGMGGGLHAEAPHLPPDLTIHYRHTICQSPILHIDSAIY